MNAPSPAIAVAATYPYGTLTARLDAVVAEFPHAAFASSLGAEDMVVTDAILSAGLPIAIFTLETGRLHRETLELLERVRKHYGHEIEAFRPDPDAMARYVKAHGLNAFYESVELRTGCCHIRKVEPLARALHDRDAWITGLRRAQSAARTELPLREHDSVHGIPKFNPLADWSEAEVWACIKDRGVPYNALHDRGYPSIGCEPCTRAVKPGEHPRAGRWWWEQDGANKECGLHVIPIREVA